MRAVRALRLGLYSLLPAALVLAACELGLAAFGRGAPTYGVTHGFNAAARYLVPDPDVSDGWRTQMYDGEQPEIRLPAKGERRRVVLYGGSNTEGFPHAYLERLLNQSRADGTPAYEVLNLGRRGYGSARSAILFEQSLVLAPDVCVFYEGHNEFIERGFELELAARGSSIERAGIALASQLRTFHALVEQFQPATRASEPPEKHAWDYEQFRAQTYDRTLEHLQSFRVNVERICTLAHEHGARMLLATAISNDLVAPFASNPPAGTPPARAQQLAQQLRRAREVFPERYRALWAQDGRDRLQQQDWWKEPSPAPPELVALRMRGGLAGVEENSPYWPPPPRWSPKLREYARMLDAFGRRELSPDERAAVFEAQARLEPLLSEFPEHAQALYARGTCEYLLGESAAAAASLRAAARFDCAPRKANDVTNGMLRDVARTRQVALCDAAAWASSRSPDGIVGYELMSDECHLHERARRPLMQLLARAILELDGADGLREKAR
jgi:hypothetical protein